MFTIYTLGEFQIRNEEAILKEEDIRSSKLTNLLGFLIIHRNQAITTDAMAEALWQEDETENPTGALKNLMYRLRTLLKKNFGEHEFILTNQGTYRWNPKLEVTVDAEQFEHFFEKGKQKQNTQESEIFLLKQAIALYHGDFMPKNMEQHWVVTLNTYYHSVYLDCVRFLCALYTSAGRYEELEELCSQAVRLERLDEDLYCYLITALTGQQKIGSAIEAYQNACRILKQQLGICELTKLKEVYMKLLKTRKSGNAKALSEVRQDISEKNPKGVFWCGYPVFREIYRLEARRTERDSKTEYLLLLTLKAKESMDKKVSEIDAFRIKNAMPHLSETLKHSLRTGDAAAQYSDAQYVVLLAPCTKEDVENVADRIISNFFQEHKIYENLKLKINMEKVETADKLLQKYTG